MRVAKKNLFSPLKSVEIKSIWSWIEFYVFDLIVNWRKQDKNRPCIFFSLPGFTLPSKHIPEKCKVGSFNYLAHNCNVGRSFAFSLIVMNDFVFQFLLHFFTLVLDLPGCLCRCRYSPKCDLTHHHQLVHHSIVHLFSGVQRNIMHHFVLFLLFGAWKNGRNADTLCIVRMRSFCLAIFDNIGHVNGWMGKKAAATTSK